jgi:hypothetical protein
VIVQRGFHTRSLSVLLRHVLGAFPLYAFTTYPISHTLLHCVPLLYQTSNYPQSIKMTLPWYPAEVLASNRMHVRFSLREPFIGAVMRRFSNNLRVRGAQELSSGNLWSVSTGFQGAINHSPAKGTMICVEHVQICSS